MAYYFEHDAGVGWKPALAVVIILHLSVWYLIKNVKLEAFHPRSMQVVEVSLLAPSAPAPQPVPVKREPLPKAQPSPAPLPVAKAPAPAAETTAATAAPAPPAPPSPQPAAEMAIEPPRYNAAYLSNPPPAYPLAARRRGIEGTVVLRVEVSADGRAARIEIKKSSNSEILDQAALAAVRSWRFVPAKRGAQTIIAWVDVPITFKLEN